MDDDLLIGNFPNRLKEAATKVIAEITASRQRSLQLALMQDDEMFVADDYGPAELLRLTTAYDIEGDIVPDYFGVSVTHIDFFSEARTEFNRRMKAER
jgi:hypothetical protein